MLKTYLKKIEGRSIWRANNERAILVREGEIKSLRARADALESTLEGLRAALNSEADMGPALRDSLSFFYRQGTERPEGFTCTFDLAYQLGYVNVLLRTHTYSLADMLELGWAEQISLKGLVVQEIKLTPLGVSELARLLRPTEKTSLFKRGGR